MRLTFRAIAVAMSFAFAAASSAKAERAGGPQPLSGLATATNTFTTDLYGRIATAEPNANLFYSPFSIEAALAMTNAGARGATAAELTHTMHFDAIHGDVNAAFAALSQTLVPLTTTDYQLNLANRLWGQKGLSFLPDYLRITREQYGAELAALDFAADQEGSRQTINTWVSEQTQGRITDLLPQGAVNADTRLVLSNAIYFKGRWDKVFDAHQSFRGEFARSDGQMQGADVMTQKSRFAYADLGDAQILEMPYAGGKIAMDIILPSADTSLAQIESQLSETQLASWFAALAPATVHVFIPRWHVEAEMALAGTLKAMGLSTLFDPLTADLSGMTGQRDLSVSAVAHKAFIDVNEDGSEAAAATAVVAQASSIMLETRFDATRPFLYLIRELDSGTILFFGRLTSTP